MPDEFRPADLERVKTYPISERVNKVSVDDFATPVDPAGSLSEFLDGLGDILAARALKETASSIVRARANGRPFYLAAGGHVVKVGLAPVILPWMADGTLSGLVVNGATAIHDWEIAAIGATSEDVDATLPRGRFGMAEETGTALNRAAREAARSGEGFGTSLGRGIVERDLPHREFSLLGRAYEWGIPVTVHIAVGSDVVHQHPGTDGASIGEASFTDFRRLVTMVSELSGGVWVNCGSAVQLPEVFLKALSVAENLGRDLGEFTTVNMDMMRHYRTEENVLRRPTLVRGRSFQLTGHHEINVPLLAAAIGAERLRQSRGEP